MKRTVAALSIVCSLTLLSGCGDDAEKAPATHSVESEAAPAATSDAFAKAKGKVVYAKTCLACHGEGGVGVENLGKNWIVSEFIKETSDEDMLAFIKAGRLADDPANTTGVAMPPSGGNPTLTDKDLNNVIVYMRSLQE